MKDGMIESGSLILDLNPSMFRKAGLLSRRG